MLSILIPTYNYNTYPLVFELKQQADLLNIPYEILVQDDCGSLFHVENEKINELENCFFRINETNLGRTHNRTILANNSKYNLLMFLDADVFPETSSFIANYHNEINKLENKVIFGGYKYGENPPKHSKSLRYYYGKAREEKDATARNKNQYAFVFSGNMLISKKVFLDYNYSKADKLYGLDIIFSHQLYINNIQANHIQNAIFHNGLEENEVFFNKSLQSVKSRKILFSETKNGGKINSLFRYYLILKKLKLHFIVKILFEWSEKYLKSKIITEKPNLFYFDLYRLGYICSLQ